MDNYQGQGFLFPSEFPDNSSSFFAPPHPVSNSIYGDLYSRRGASSGPQFSNQSTDHLGFGGLYNMTAGMPMSSSPFGSLHGELIEKMSAQDVMDAKALAASKSHSEAERRRRERINAHLAKLRSLLPSTTKTDKASLLAEVIQHVKELKRQTSEISKDNYPLPTEIDELTLDTSTENGRFIVKASLCCEDRDDLIPDLIKALEVLKLRTLKAEITTLGGRVKNILIVTGEDDQSIVLTSIEDALRAVMERTTASAADTSSQSGGAGIKRQRTSNLSNIIIRQRSF